MCFKLLCSVGIITLLCLGVSKCDSNFFVSKKYKQDQYHCVTNSSFALTWIGKEEEQNSVSRYISAPMKSRIVCDFRTEDYSNCTSFYTKQLKWSLNNSLDVNINEVILDQRWEEIRTINIPASDEKDLKYHNVISILKDDFEIPFSLRSEKESHIFLCDGPSPPEANCYWFLLQAWNGNKSAIRKCKIGTIPKERWPTDKSCKEIHAFVEHPKFPPYLSDKYWAHFKIGKKQNFLSIQQITDDKNPTILELTENEMFTNIKYMIIHNKMVNSLWKIHQTEIIYTKEEQSSFFGARRKPVNGSICISMFLSMCPMCKFKLDLITETPKLIKEMSYEVLNSKWSEIKFFADNLEDVQHSLKISTIGKNSEKFWAIDKVRECQKEEFRIISTSSSTPCQLMSNNNNVISYNPRSSTEIFFENTCPEYTLGEFCVPCTWIYDKCEKISICSKYDHNRRTRCFCSAGYHELDFGCAYDCDFGFYGHECKKRCNYCQSGCSNINGSCSGCIEYYSGSNCSILNATVFANPPSILSFNYTGATIEMDSFDLKNMTSGEAEYYFFQIKSGKQNWTNVGSKIPFNEKRTFKIDKLTPDTEYFVRAVIETKDKRNYSGDRIPFINFTTKCEEISKDNIDVEPSNTTVQLVIKQNMQLACRNTNITLNDETKQNVSTNNVTFNGLEPFTNYTITIQSGSRMQKSIKFHTIEGIPTKITGIYLKSKSSSSISLKWNPPEHIYGNLRCYTIEYQLQLRKGCKSKKKSQPIKVNVTSSAAMIEGLKPHSKYSFLVYAVNERYNGVSESINEDTLALEHISTEEIPATVNPTSGNETVIIELSEVHCLEGPLNVTANLKCLSEWCQNENEVTLNEEMPRSSLELRKLFPFTNYTLNLKFCRNNTLCKEKIEGRIIETKPSAPHPVEDLLVYSKTETTISLRWKQPYPPTGILASYKIEYDYPAVIYGKHENQVNTSITQCKFWPKFHCAKLTKLESNKVYTVKVFAKNKDPENYGLSKEIVTTTKTEKSEAPSGLKYSWTMTNDLELEWKHPIRSNGVIRYFDISLAGPSIKNPITKKYPVTELTEETYQRTYHEMINATELLPATKYLISVAAYNGNFGEKAENETDDGPPDIPSFEKIPEFKSVTNTTITVNFKAQKPRDTQTTDYNFFLLVSDDKGTDLQSFEELRDLPLPKKRLICKSKIANFEKEQSFTIGNQSEMCENVSNPSLKPQTVYNITVILTNTLNDKTRYVLHYKMVESTEKLRLVKPNSGLFALLVLLLIIPIALFLYMKKDKLMSMKSSLLTDNDSAAAILDNKNESQIPLSSVPNEPAPKPTKPIKPKTSEKIHSKCIQVTNFENYVKECVQNGEFERQHGLFPRGQTKPWTYGAMKENKSKNRYTNLIAYDHSRVILEKLENDPYSDYINASYIDGHRIPKAYIATQGPKLNTLFDFWRMIWQENVEHIVMLANVYEDGKKKVEKYWPAINETFEAGDIAIQHISNEVFADFEHRIFNVTRNGETRQVDQLHFLSWPDHGIPLYSQSMVPFLQKMLKFPLSSKSPIVVHCSAGVGRTGTILLCDICLRMAAREGSIDALRKLQKLREQRANLVDNVEQYKLAHLVIMETLVGMHTTIPCNEITFHVERLLKSDGISLQMQYLKDTKWQDDAMKTIGTHGKTPVVFEEKNRFPHIIPEIQGRVFICREPQDDETSSYINAVKVDGFKSPGRYIVTQQPLPNTVGDFWHLIRENDVSVIISLNTIDLNDKTSCDFWPSSNNPQMDPVGSINLTHAKTLNLECYDLVTVHLNNSKMVEIYAMKNWPPQQSCPMSREQFLTFWEDSDAASRRSQTVVVTCYDGVKASGIYVAMSFIIEKMKLEHSCDVCQAVRTVRHNRNQFIQEEEQFVFLYQAAVDYINGFESYANFS